MLWHDVLLARSPSSWQRGRESQGMLRSAGQHGRTFTLLPPHPGPCRRQPEQQWSQEPATRQTSERPDASGQVHSVEPHAIQMIPESVCSHRTLSEEARNKILSLFLCTHTRAHVCVRVCVCQKSIKQGSPLDAATTG